MSRYRLIPTPAQEEVLLTHCAHARFVWNLAVEQQTFWSPHRGRIPGYVEQARQLTEARADFEWLRAGSVTVQQQALRDFGQAMTSFFAGTHRRPNWRKAGRHEGFRQVGLKPHHIRNVSSKWGAVLVPKIGWVRFRLSRAVPTGVKSYRITRDRAGRWHIAFAAVPDPIPAPGNGETVGVDRGVATSAATSEGHLLNVPCLTGAEARRLRLLQRKLSRAQRGSNRRTRLKAAIARLKARQADRRKNWVEQTSTHLARAFDLIGVEDLNIAAMTRSAKGTIAQPGTQVRQKAGLNRGILHNSWGLLAARLENKAPGRVVMVRAAYTSQTCSRCGTIDSGARESQARFSCRSCHWSGHADVNAALNIRTRACAAAGRAVAARGGSGLPGPVNREPRRTLLPTSGTDAVGIPLLQEGEDVKGTLSSMGSQTVLASSLIRQEV